jgi:hypothetical protein
MRKVSAMSQHKEQGTSRDLTMAIAGGVLTTLLLAVLSHLNRLGALALMVGSVVAFNVIWARDWKEVRTRSTGRKVSWTEAVLTLSFVLVVVVVVGLVVVTILQRLFIE